MYNNQEDRVMNYLKTNGTIQPLQAWSELGVYRLAAVIFKLRKIANITTTKVNVVNQFGEKCKVAQYVLEK